MRFGWALALGAGVVLIILAVMVGAVRLAARKVPAGSPKPTFFGTVILGKDNRTSTSKTFVFMWTLLIGWAIVSLVIAGEIAHIHSCVQMVDKMGNVKRCPGKDKLGLFQQGWNHFVSMGLTGSYMVLLGIPGSAAVAAKVLTQSKNATDDVPKTTATDEADTSPSARVAQIFSADDGTTDIGDLQYVIFNIVTAIYFVSHLIHDPFQGLPPIPDTLLGLTGVSGALYVGKKAVTSEHPVINGVFPSVLRPARPFIITGTALTPLPGAMPGLPEPQVTVNGLECGDVRSVGEDRITATAPPDGLIAADAGAPINGKVQVLTSYSVLTDVYDKVEIAPP